MKEQIGIEEERDHKVEREKTESVNEEDLLKRGIREIQSPDNMDRIFYGDKDILYERQRNTERVKKEEEANE